MINDISLRLRRRLWDAQRFGVSPGKLYERLTAGVCPSVLCISLPKAGTHLLERAVCRLPGIYRKVLPTIHDENIVRWGELGDVLAGLGQGQVAVAHLSFTEARSAALARCGTRGFFVVRDPRDIVVSQANYIMSKPDHPQHEVFAREKDQRSRILRAIRGNESTGLDSVGQRLRGYSGWLNSADLLTVRFEELVGSTGPGGREKQMAVVASVAKHLGADLEAAAVDRLQEGVFSEVSPTFHSGGRGGWRQVFDDELLSAFDEEASDELSRYGYT